MATIYGRPNARDQKGGIWMTKARLRALLLAATAVGLAVAAVVVGVSPDVSWVT
jgi:hypothetical protein